MRPEWVTDRKAIFEYLSYWEAIALGTKQEVFDFDTLNQQAGGHIVAIAENYAAWFEARRALYGPLLYVGIEELANRVRRAREHDPTPGFDAKQ